MADRFEGSHIDRIAEILLASLARQERAAVRGRDGGLARGRMQRAESLARYNANPRTCKQCGKELRVPDHVKPSQFTNEFCDHSCAAMFNNANGIIPRRLPGKGKPPRQCPVCEVVFVPKLPGRKADRQIHCSSSCTKRARRLLALARRKDEVFRDGRNWQPARSTIQRLARQLFFESDARRCCEVCGYDKHIEVSHRRPVSDFPGHATVAEINALTNLRALCPNHHWEYDNGLLVEADGLEPSQLGL